MVWCQYEQLDGYGIAIGLAAFLIALTYAYSLLYKVKLNQKSILSALLLSAVGHFVGAFALFEFAVRLGADSCFYFEKATMKYQGTGYYFAFLILGYAKEYLLGESFLGAFLISGAIALVGSTYLVLIYKILLDKISGNYRYYLMDSRQLTYPIFLLFCWPSYLFWSAGIIKDNFAFLAITMTLYVVVRGKIGFSSLLYLMMASFLGFMVRPYLFLIFAASTFIYLLLGSNLKLIYKLLMLGVLWFVFTLLLPILGDYGNLGQVMGKGSLEKVGHYAITQQGNMAIGSSIPVPTHNPRMIFLFIPYLIFANLLLPLGIGARNLIGAVSSIENLYLLSWIKIMPGWVYSE